MSQTPFSEFSDYLETNEVLTPEHLTSLTSTPFKDVVLEEVIETAVTLASALAKAGFLPEKAQGRARLSVARELLRQCTENHIVFTPVSSSPIGAGAGTAPVVRIISDRPEELKTPELIDRIALSLERAEQPDPREVAELRHRLPGQSFIRNLTTGLLDAAASKELIAAVGTAIYPTSWKGYPTETLDEVLKRKIFANPFSHQGLYDPTDQWLTIPVRLREVLIYVLTVKKVQLDEDNALIQLQATPLTQRWDTWKNEYEALLTKTDTQSLMVVARVRAGLYFQEGGQPGKSTNPFDEALPQALVLPQIHQDRVNLLVLYHEKQQDHADALDGHFLQMAADYDLNVIFLCVNKLQTFNMDDLESIPAVFLLTSPQLNTSFVREARDFIRTIIDFQRRGKLRVVPIVVVAHNHESTIFGKLQPLPRSRTDKGFASTNDEVWSAIVSDVRDFCIGFTVRLWLNSLSFEQVQQLCRRIGVTSPYAEAGVPAVVQDLLSRYGHYNAAPYALLAEKIREVK